MDKDIFDKIIEILTTHEEGDGDYCDTGEDMDWECRSKCVEHAVDRLYKAFNAGEI